MQNKNYFLLWWGGGAQSYVINNVSVAGAAKTESGFVKCQAYQIRRNN